MLLLILLATLVSAGYLIRMVLIAAGLYKEPVLRSFERYAQIDDDYYMLPQLLLGMGTFSIVAGILFSAAVSPRFPPLLVGSIFLILSYLAYNWSDKMRAFPQIFMAVPRWYVELRDRTTREERRHIAYMWLCLPPRMRMHLNGSDHHFLLWADQVILGTVTQTVEDQEASVEDSHYHPDLYGRFG